jgi:hypothetical protein
MGLIDLFSVFGKGMSFFRVVSCDILSGGEDLVICLILQRIIGGICWSEALQERFYAAFFS